MLNGDPEPGTEVSVGDRLEQGLERIEDRIERGVETMREAIKPKSVSYTHLTLPTTPYV